MKYWENKTIPIRSAPTEVCCGFDQVQPFFGPILTLLQRKPAANSYVLLTAAVRATGAAVFGCSGQFGVGPVSTASGFDATTTSNQNMPKKNPQNRGLFKFHVLSVDLAATTIDETGEAEQCNRAGRGNHGELQEVACDRRASPA